MEYFNYTGTEYNRFYTCLSNIITKSIIDFYENNLIYENISLNYFYFNSYEKKQILENTILLLSDVKIGNIRYDYFYPVNDSETVLLIDSWENQEAIDVHHGTPMMNTIFRLREKYNLHMKVERYISDDEIPETDKKYIKS